jgi:hypothetical protein
LGIGIGPGTENNAAKAMNRRAVRNNGRKINMGQGAMPKKAHSGSIRGALSYRDKSSPRGNRMPCAWITFHTATAGLDLVDSGIIPGSVQNFRFIFLNTGFCGFFLS